MADRPLNVLFLCTGNSARSILAESLTNQRGRGRFVGYSAGSYPKGQVHPLAMELLKNRTQTFVVHGDPAAADTLRSRIQDELGWRVKVPEHLSTVAL